MREAVIGLVTSLSGADVMVTSPYVIEVDSVSSSSVPSRSITVRISGPMTVVLSSFICIPCMNAVCMVRQGRSAHPHTSEEEANGLSFRSEGPV